MPAKMEYDEQVEKWFALETPFEDEVKQYWGGDWGVCSEVGVKNFIPFHIPFGHAHVDGLMNMVAPDLALIFPWQTSHEVWAELRKRGIEVLQAPSVDEVKAAAVNFVALAPRKVVMSKGNPQTRELLAVHGVEIIEADVSEIEKGWGSLHCMTAFLKRD